MNIIKENWEAIEKAEEKMKEQTGDPEAAFNPNLFFLDGIKKLVISGKYRKKNKRSADGFTKSYSEISTIAKFCPFTGKPLYEESNDEIKATCQHDNKPT